jgi:hypothetical protein
LFCSTILYEHYQYARTDRHRFVAVHGEDAGGHAGRDRGFGGTDQVDRRPRLDLRARPCRNGIWQHIHPRLGSGQEIAFCCFNATLRDYARLARLLAHDGAWEGRQLIPRQWLLDATTVRPEDRHLAPGVARLYLGYGYQVWLLPGEQRRFALLGIRGQIILVDPASKLVMVHTAVRKKPREPGGLTEPLALWSAVLQQLGQ